MATKTIKVLRKFYHNGALQDVGKIIMVSEVEAKGYVGSNKAEIIPEPPPTMEAKKEEPKKEDPKEEVPKSKEPIAESKKGGKEK